MFRRSIIAIASASVALAAVAPTVSAAPRSLPAADPPITELTLGAVPSLSLGLIKLGSARGDFKKAGLRINIVPVDSGPNVVTGVVAGQYDLGYTAYAPPLLAYANGQPLRLVSNIDTVGKAGTNGGVLVRKDSGITSWKDLAGKRIASNAPRSLFSLVIPAAVQAAGADPRGIQIVPLPFASIGKAVADGQVDAGAILEPFQTQALAQYTNLTNLGDATRAVLPEGSVSGVVFTSASTLAAKSAAIAKFKSVLNSLVPYANKNRAEAKKYAATLAGLTPEQAQALPLGAFSTGVTAASLQPLVNLMIAQKWIASAPNLGPFLGQ